jgi:3-isopropylmalate/(R)-2-methylmalate dehydratase large subunit
MGMTIAEKALARAASIDKISPGEYVDARIDRIIASHSAVKMQAEAIKAGFEEGIPKVWDRDKVYIYMEHNQPALNLPHAKAQKMLREMVEKYKITNFQDAVFGVIHQLAAEECVVPGELVLGNDSHTCAWGALNCVSAAFGEHELAYAFCFGEIWMRVPETVKVVLKGELPAWDFAKDIVLWLAGKYTTSFALDQSIAASVAGKIVDPREVV